MEPNNCDTGLHSEAEVGVGVGAGMRFVPGADSTVVECRAVVRTSRNRAVETDIGSGLVGTRIEDEADSGK